MEGVVLKGETRYDDGGYTYEKDEDGRGLALAVCDLLDVGREVSDKM